MKKRKISPSKQEVMDTLAKEEPEIKGYGKATLIIEHKKVSKEFGVIKAELYQKDKLIARGAMTCVPETTEDSFYWDLLKVGESRFDGYSLDYQRETVGSIVREGIKKALKEGRIPYIK